MTISSRKGCLPFHAYELRVLSVLNFRTFFFLSETGGRFISTYSKQEVNASGTIGDTTLHVPSWFAAAVGTEADGQADASQD